MGKRNRIENCLLFPVIRGIVNSHFVSIVLSLKKLIYQVTVKDVEFERS